MTKQLPLQKTSEGKTKVLCLLVDGASEISLQPTDQHITYINQIIELNQKNPSFDVRPYQKMQEAYLQWQKSDFENALINLKKAVELFDQQKKVIAPLLTKIRTLYNRMNKQEERFEFYKEKLNYYLLNGPVENTASCYHGIAGYYNYKADYNLAISNYLRAAEIFKPYWQYFYNNEMAVVAETYKRWGNDEKADYYLKIALPLLRAHNDSSNIAFCLNALININTKQKKYKQALEYADECIKLTNRNDKDPSYALVIMNKVFVYLDMGQPALAYPYLMEVKTLINKFHFQLSGNEGDLESDFGFYKYYRLINDQKNAGTFLLSAYNKAVAENVNVLKLKYLKELASFYQKQQPQLSIQYINEYFKIRDTLENGNQKFKVAQYEIDKKEHEQDQSINALKQEKAIQEATISQRNTILWISLIALLLIAVSMVFLYRQFHNNRKTLRALRKTQRQLVLSEKMASLGELTAGIAHEIQNPLNFVNNFSEVNTELIEEMKQEIENGNLQEAKILADDIAGNELKINQHGKRADAIVKGMLQHSRNSSGIKELTDINALADEYLRLAYHGLRAKDKSFNASMKTNFDQSIGNVNLNRQDIGRVILNLITNAFYSVTEKKNQNIEGFEPLVSVSTYQNGNMIEIKISDNGEGISPKVLDKIFQPFFTTKPSGQGTGLGLSMSFDIVKSHDGELKVETKEGEGSAFIIQIPV